MSRLDKLLTLKFEAYNLHYCLPGNNNWVYEAITHHPDGGVGNWCEITERTCADCPMNQDYLKTLVNQYK